MEARVWGLAAAVLAGTLVDACTTYGPPPRSGYIGEGWRQHVRRCLRHYPRYDPRTDLIERPEGAYRCPL